MSPTAMMPHPAKPVKPRDSAPHPPYGQLRSILDRGRAVLRPCAPWPRRNQAAGAFFGFISRLNKKQRRPLSWLAGPPHIPAPGASCLHHCRPLCGRVPPAGRMLALGRLVLYAIFWPLRPPPLINAVGLSFLHTIADWIPRISHSIRSFGSAKKRFPKRDGFCVTLWIREKNPLNPTSAPPERPHTLDNCMKKTQYEYGAARRGNGAAAPETVINLCRKFFEAELRRKSKIIFKLKFKGPDHV